MRRILARVVALWLFCVGLMVGSVGHAQTDFKVTLLGTASPSPRVDLFGPSTLVEAGDQKLLFDAGRGVPIRLRQLNVPLGKINVLFLTHYHWTIRRESQTCGSPAGYRGLMPAGP